VACSTNCEMVNAYTNLLRSKDNIPFGRHWRRWDDNFGNDNRGVEFIHWAV
jgi:hypothetical protein